MADILLLEPDKLLAETYQAICRHAGHTIRQAVSAQEAVFAVDERMPDVILVELQLIAHSGIEFMYELRSYHEWQTIPLLIHSCIPPSEFEDSMALLQGMLGVKEYLYKPHTTLQDLLQAISNAVPAEQPEPSVVQELKQSLLPSARLQTS
ncbi:MAG TPA: response regulator [Candidatus Limnocylindrales bacterium]|nr:response regulator [Candidatus Limnocylindrales bacterium]